ncbi:glycosyltransferase family 1 protein [Nocardioides sp. Y6]|uniref:Glycosyltransferase family 1 protein n=1 Tax=Nocardioides malaquae TaxID=2773426 RepID=A0ABR9RWN1_9ACTN|nr:glycosyltransferase [Nocardioides malaquae]MBE7325964.1 glycosyltransferase family 1 protein [Nocardioides malaquae]
MSTPRSHLLLAMGSRGDVEPMVALAVGLGAAGHRARVVGLADYAPLAAAHDVEYVSVDARIDDALALAHGRVGRRLLSTAPAQGLVLRSWMRGLAAPFADAVLGAAAPGEVVVTGVLTRDVATALAEDRGCRPVLAVHTAQVPTMLRESHFFAHWFTDVQALNRLGVRLNWQISTSLGRDVAVHVRRRLGLRVPGLREATARGDAFPTVVTASPLLVPPAADWPPGTHQTGALVLPEEPFTPDAVLADFLAAGAAPVFVGFGSMARTTGAEIRALVTEAARLTGLRVVTPADPGRPTARLTGDVLAVAEVPHPWLFDRMRAVVHHGGAGTSGTALRAGVPSAAVAFGADQPFHAHRLHALGVGPLAPRIQRLTGARLAQVLREMTSGPHAEGYRARAAELGALARAEDGVGRTVALLDELMA